MTGYFDELGGQPNDIHPGYFDDHPPLCTSECIERGVPTTLVRDRPPAWPCTFCGAPAYVACLTNGRRRGPLKMFGRFHPSRIEAA